MRELVPAEWMKAWTGKAWWLLPCLGSVLLLLSNLGLASMVHQQLLAHQTDPVTATDGLVRNMFAMLLFAALFGAVTACREQHGGAFGRAVLLSPTRDRLLAAKLLVVTAVGALFGLLAVTLALASVFPMMSAFGDHAVLGPDTVPVLLGVFAVNALAAPWGLLLGLIVRHQIGAIVLVMSLCLLVEPGLQKLVPSMAKFLPTIAMSSVYHDVLPDLLPVPLALLTIFAWLLALGLVARQLLMSRDIT